jgi:hypothetical protein
MSDEMLGLAAGLSGLGIIGLVVIVGLVWLFFGMLAGVWVGRSSGEYQARAARMYCELKMAEQREKRSKSQD